MRSKLVVLPVERLQEKVNDTITILENGIGIYVSLNKAKRSLDNEFNKNNIKTKKIFFIDCVTSEEKEGDAIKIKPNNLEELSHTIKTFTKEIKGEKYLILDALSTLLIYNSENQVASFVQEITEYYAQKNTKVIAFSPTTQGEDLLNKIFNFFDEVERWKKTPE